MEQNIEMKTRIPISEILSKFGINGEVISCWVPPKQSGPVTDRHLLVRTLQKP